MAAESGSSSGYMGAFQDFVKSVPEENSPSPAPAQRPAGCVMEPVAGTSAVDNYKPSSSSSSAAKRRKIDSDDSDDDTESDVANDKSVSSDNEDSEPPAVPKRPRTQRSAKQKLMSKISSRGRGRGRGRSFALFWKHIYASTHHIDKARNINFWVI